MCAKPPWNGLKLALVVVESRTHTSQTRVHRTRLRFPCSELPPLWVPNLGGKRNVLFSSTFSLHRNSGLIFGHNFGLIKLTSRFLLASHASRRATTHFTTMAMMRKILKWNAISLHTFSILACVISLNTKWQWIVVFLTIQKQCN